MDEIKTTVDQIVHSIRTKENNRRRKNRRRVQTLIDQFEKFDISSTPGVATDLGKTLSQDDELQEVLLSFVNELGVSPLLDYISDHDVKKSKGKQKAKLGKAKKVSQEMKLQTNATSSNSVGINNKVEKFKMQGQENDVNPLTNPENTKCEESLLKPTIVGGVIKKKKSLRFAPDQLASKIEEARKDPSKNTWNLPMSDFSRDQIMSYVQGYFGPKRSEILQSIHRCDPTFTQMVSTAVKYWDDRQLIEPLLGMVQEVFKNTTDSKETYHWLVNEKVELAIVLVACFLRDEDILGRVLQILYIANTVPFATNYDKAEELLLIAPYVLTSFKRIHTDSSSLLHVMTIMQCMGHWMQNMYNDEDIHEVKRLIVREGIIDVIVEVLSYHKTCTIHHLSIYLVGWVKDVVQTTNILPMVPSVLECLNETLLNQSSSIDSEKSCQIISNCIAFLLFLTSKISFEEMVTILNNDFIDMLISSARVKPKIQYVIRNILALAVERAGENEIGEIPYQHRQTLEEVFEYMVNKMKRYPLPINNFEACSTQLIIIASVFLITSTERRHRMIDDGTFLMMIEILLKAEDLESADKGKNKFDPVVKFVLNIVAEVTVKEGHAIIIKIAKIMMRFPMISLILAKYIKLIPSLILITLLMNDDCI